MLTRKWAVVLLAALLLCGLSAAAFASEGFSPPGANPPAPQPAVPAPQSAPVLPDEPSPAEDDPSVPSEFDPVDDDPLNEPLNENEPLEEEISYGQAFESDVVWLQLDVDELLEGLRRGQAKVEELERQIAETWDEINAIMIRIDDLILSGADEDEEFMAKAELQWKFYELDALKEELRDQKERWKEQQKKAVDEIHDLEARLAELKADFEKDKPRLSEGEIDAIETRLADVEAALDEARDLTGWFI